MGRWSESGIYTTDVMEAIISNDNQGVIIYYYYFQSGSGKKGDTHAECGLIILWVSLLNPEDRGRTVWRI